MARNSVEKKRPAPYPKRTTRNRPLVYNDSIGLKIEGELLSYVDRDAARERSTRSWIIRRILAAHYALRKRKPDPTAA
jgi:hypothetical protein